MSKEVFNALLLLIPAMLLSATGELFLKRGMNEIGEFHITLETLLPMLLKIALNPNILIGFIGFGGGSVFWLSVISRVPLSLAYPMLALSYVIVVVESWIFLGEGLHPLRIIGSVVVGIGVAIVGLSSGEK